MDAAGQVLTTFVEESKEAGIDWWKTDHYEALSAAVREATGCTEVAALAVRRTVVDKATAPMIDAVKAARGEVNVVENAVSRRRARSVDLLADRVEANVAEAAKALSRGDVSAAVRRLRPARVADDRRIKVLLNMPVARPGAQQTSNVAQRESVCTVVVAGSASDGGSDGEGVATPEPSGWPGIVAIKAGSVARIGSCAIQRKKVLIRT